MSEPYNFAFPLPTDHPLQTRKLRLLPFDSNLAHHANLYATLTSASDAALQNFKFLPYGPFRDGEEFLKWYVPTIQRERGVVWFAIFVKKQGGEDEQVEEKQVNRPLRSNADLDTKPSQLVGETHDAGIKARKRK